MTPYWRCVTLRHITLQGSQTRGNVRSAVESTRFHDKKNTGLQLRDRFFRSVV